MFIRKSGILALFLLFALNLQPRAMAEKAENFTFKDIYGKAHSLADYQGKWVIVNYWGTYCPPCLEEIPDLVNFAGEHEKDAVILGLDAGGSSVEELKTFAEENLIDYVIAPVQQSTLTAFGIILGIPTSYIISPEGDVLLKVVGIIDLDEVEEFMQQHTADSDDDDETVIGGILDI